MNRRWLLAGTCAALLMVAASAHAQSEVYFGFHTGVRGGPVSDFGWRSAPRTVVVRDVYVVDDPYIDDDVFQYHGGWYRVHQGYWYQGRNWRGPWRAVDVRYVPRPIFYVPQERWRHHPLGGPPGQMRRRYDRGDSWDRGDRGDRGRGDGRGNGNGNGRGHGHGHGGDHD